MITEVANFKKEGLVTPEGVEGEKGILKINLSMQGNEPWSPARKARVLTTTLTGHCTQVYFASYPDFWGIGKV